jgi:hypothetical protein
MAGSASLASVVIPGSIASAAAKSVSCKTVSGSESTQTISGCTGSDVSQTGTTGSQKAVLKSGTGGKQGTTTIKWKNGKTTIYTFTVIAQYKEGSSSDKCPAVSGKTNIEEAVATITVTGGTTTALKGGKFTEKTCAYTSPLTVKNLGSETF